VTLLLALGLAAAPGLAQGAQPASPGAALGRMAEERLLQLHAREGAAAPQQVLLRNLSRYFVRYTVPTRGDELGRLLGTLERMIDAAAETVLRAASDRARQRGAEVVEASDLGRALDDLVPAELSEWGDTVFFPLAPTSDQVVVEVADLQAFAETGIAWQRLLALAEGSEAPPLPLTPEAGTLLAQGLQAYGLLLLRLGGDVARADYAEGVASHHLRDAGARLAERARAHGAAPERPPDRTFDDAPAGSLFRDVTAGSGIRFRHVSSPWISHFRRYGPVSPTFSGGGVSVGDVDGDRFDDLVYCGGQGCMLYRNRADGTFEDITARAGIGVPGEARMALLADFDNDGDPDLFLTYARDGNRLFRNRGGGAFEEVTAGSGLDRDGDISGPATSADFDGDGLLDLYVGNFGDYLAGENPWSPTDSTNGLPNRLYLNRGDLRFEDVTDRAGVGDTGWTQALSHCDCDGDGDQDLYVANDFGRNELYLNRGDATFEAAAATTGSDDRFHGMNVAFSDLNRDALPDIFVTNIWDWDPVREETTESNTLLLSHRDGGKLAYRRSDDAALLARDTGWAWGALFFDADLDADDDLFVANGLTDYFTFSQMRRHPEDPERLYAINNGREPNHFFRNDGGTPSVVVEGSGLELPGVNSRGVALLDYDRDGDQDVALSAFHAAGRLLRNEALPAAHRWLEVDLEGDPERATPRQPFGATVTARSGEISVWRALTGGEGYLSQSSSTLHFGLGTADRVDLEVRWPNGDLQQLAEVPTGQRIRIRQGEAGFETVPPATP
jgi:hypothetical protein